MEDLDGRAQKKALIRCSGGDPHSANTVSGPEGDLTRTQTLLDSRPKWNDPSAEWRAGEIYKGLSPKAMGEFESFGASYCCEGTTVLFAEEEKPHSILFLIEGRVKLTMNTSVGKRLTLGIAVPGDVLGLSLRDYGSRTIPLQNQGAPPEELSRPAVALPGCLPKLGATVEYGVQTRMRTIAHPWLCIDFINEAGNAIAAVVR